MTTTAQSQSQVQAKQTPGKPYKRTGQVTIDCLLTTAYLMGASEINLSGGVMSCIYQEQAYTISVTAAMRCTEIIDILRKPPAGECNPDPASWTVQQAA